MKRTWFATLAMLFCFAGVAAGQTWDWKTVGVVKEIKISDDHSPLPFDIKGVKQVSQKSLSLIVGNGVSTIKKTLQTPFALYGSELILNLDVKISLLKFGPRAYVWIKVGFEDGGIFFQTDYDYPLTTPSPEGSNGRWLRLRNSDFHFDTLSWRSGIKALPDEIGNVTVEITAFDVESCEVKLDNLTQERFGRLYLIDTFGDGDMQKPAAPTIANFPNPFNLTTQVIFRVTGQDPYNTLHINLDMYDMLGRRVVTLVDGEMVPGTYTVTLLPPATTSSGTYFLYLRISTFLENYTQSRKIVLLK